jgi:hypothetical protein
MPVPNPPTFAPGPENDFAEFIRVYYEESRAQFDKIEAFAAKWRFEDLIPGLSDVDSRLICHDSMTVEEWCRLSSLLGELHLDLCCRYPQWARNLEHPPGAHLTWAELNAAGYYSPECHHWTFYHSQQPDKVQAVIQSLAARPWDSVDEHFYLSKFCAYYGRYDRALDPPINLGAHADRHPLHSRIMHYFNPPVHAAVCLLKRHHFAGKWEAFAAAAQICPELRCWNMAQEILAADYRTPQWVREPLLTELEDELETALQALETRLREVITLIPREAGTDVATWKQALQAVPVDPARVVFDRYKFARLVKGRLWFYLHAPAHFEALWLIQNELGRLGDYYFRTPFRTYWQARTGEMVEDPTTILDELRGELLTDADIAAVREFVRLTPRQWEVGRERETTAEIVAIFDDYFAALTKIHVALAANNHTVVGNAAGR